MQCYFRDPAQNQGMMGMPGQNAGMMGMTPMMNMTEPQLEALYPNTYNIIQPQVENMCNIMEAHHGKMYCPSNKEMKDIVDQIYTNVESDVEAATKENPNDRERQFFGGGRRILRDLIGILLIGNLIRRRRRPFYAYPGYYGGFSPYGGYPYY